jgi:hypothetical protein
MTCNKFLQNRPKKRNPTQKQPTDSPLFCFCFFWGTPWEFKNTIKIFLQKVHVENLFRENSQKTDKIFVISFSSTFLFYRVFRCFLAMGVQKHYKKRFTNRSCRKVFQKSRSKNPKPTFSRFFLNHVFGRFSVRGVQKQDKKIRKKSDRPWYFFGPRGTNQPRQGPSLFFLSAPRVCFPVFWRRQAPGSVSDRACCTSAMVSFGLTFAMPTQK